MLMEGKDRQSVSATHIHRYMRYYKATCRQGNNGMCAVCKRRAPVQRRVSRELSGLREPAPTPLSWIALLLAYAVLPRGCCRREFCKNQSWCYGFLPEHVFE